MLFNSIDFAIFLPIVFIIYWIIGKDKIKLQNLIILAASYLFYGWWDWRFLSLIIFSTIVDYIVGLKLSREKNDLKRKVLLWVSIFVNIGFLGFFKYYNFFIDNFNKAFSLFGVDIQGDSLNIILPVGISFYTFQTLSYTIDVYKNKLNPTHDILAFSTYVSFFPQLVAGPIERASNLLPQFESKRYFDNKKASDGMRQILWGLFKKVVIADNCAEYANQIFNNSAEMSGSNLFLGALFFTFQIYGDFSGYSDIAIGTSRLFGFNLMKNFAFPYFSRDIAEFWRRWHISLSTWFRDYLYIPLGGSKGGKKIKVRNTFIIFIVSGFWHGANWTFIVWGALNALFFLPLLLTNNNRNNLEIIAKNKYLPDINEFLKMLSTFLLTAITWIFFRADNIEHALNYIAGIFSTSLFSKPSIFPVYVFILLIIFIIIEWINREKEHGLCFEKNGNEVNLINRVLRWNLYLAIGFAIAFFIGKQNTFIYFQF